MRGSGRTWEEPMHEVSHRRTVQPLLAGGDPRLTRAIVCYRYDQFLDDVEPGADDLGLALILAGEPGVSADVIDLGSARPRAIRLDEELFVLDRLPEPSFHYLALLRSMDGYENEYDRPSGPLTSYCQALALGVLRRVGCNPMTRPVLLRVGFRDIVRDLDPNERVAVRVVTGGGESASLYLDGDRNVLMVNASRSVAQRIEPLLRKHFPESSPHRPHDGEPMYELRFPIPLTLHDVERMIDQIRDGALGLYAELEPERHELLSDRLAVFGARDTLARLRPMPRVVPVRAASSALVAGSV